MTKEELLAEEHICNGKCQDDITRNYVHCKTCTRLNDFLAGYKTGKEELEAQIEKMRNCANCKNYNSNEGFCVLGSGYGYNCNLEKWEIKENDIC